jgi:hypothetical protein
MDAQRLSDAGTEAVGLNQGSNQGTNVFDAGALGQITERLYTRLSGAGLKVKEMELAA